MFYLLKRMNSMRKIIYETPSGIISKTHFKNKNPELQANSFLSKKDFQKTRGKTTS